MSCCWKELNEQKIKFSPQISQIQFYKFTIDSVYSNDVYFERQSGVN